MSTLYKHIYISVKWTIDLRNSSLSWKLYFDHSGVSRSMHTGLLEQRLRRKEKGRNHTFEYRDLSRITFEETATDTFVQGDLINGSELFGLAPDVFSEFLLGSSFFR